MTKHAAACVNSSSLTLSCYAQYLDKTGLLTVVNSLSTVTRLEGGKCLNAVTGINITIMYIDSKPSSFTISQVGVNVDI